MEITIRKIAFAFIFCFSSFIAAIAQPSLKTIIDKNGILIGEQVKLKVVATLPEEDFFVKWIEMPDSLQHFELVEQSKIDSTFHNQKLTKLSQTLTFTSFDSGKWTMPAFNIDFNPSTGGESYNLYTDTFSIDVSYQADSTNVLRDIKPIREAPAMSWLQLLIIITVAGLIFLLLLAWLLYYIIKKRNQRKQAPKQTLSAYQNAMNELDKILQVNVADAVAIKLYHTRLTEILKKYLSSTEGPYFISSTTGEVLILLNQKGLDKAAVSKTAEALRCSDAAKFAKYIPSKEESKQSWQSIKQAIDLMEQLQNKKEESGT